MNAQFDHFRIPSTARAFVKAPPLERFIEVEIIGYQWSGHGENMAIVRSIDEIQPMPFYRPGTLYPTNYAIVPTSSVVITLEQGTGPIVELITINKTMPEFDQAWWDAIEPIPYDE